MKNGTHFNRLTSANSSQVDGSQDDAASYYPYKSQPDQVFSDEAAQIHRTFVVFLSLSITCAAVTLVTGSYAAWLSRHQAARQALTDVNDILRSCQSRMSQLEADLQRLPNRQG